MPKFNFTAILVIESLLYTEIYIKIASLRNIYWRFTSVKKSVRHNTFFCFSYKQIVALLHLKSKLENKNANAASYSFSSLSSGNGEKYHWSFSLVTPSRVLGSHLGDWSLSTNTENGNILNFNNYTTFFFTNSNWVEVIDVSLFSYGQIIIYICPLILNMERFKMLITWP